MNIFTQYKGLSRSVYIIFIGRMITTMGAFIWPMLTMIMSIKLGYDETDIAIIFMIVTILFLPATILAGKIADKFNKKLIIAVFDVISVCFFFVNAFIEPGNLMLIFFVIAGLFATMEGPAYEALVMEATLPKERTKVYSLTYLGHNVGFMIGAALSGFLIANHLSLAFILDGVTTLTSTFLIVLLVKTYRPEEIVEMERNEYEEKADDTHSTIKVLKTRKSIIVQIGIMMITAFIYDQWTFVLPLNMADIFGDIRGPEIYGLVASANGLVVILFTPILTLVMKKVFELKKILLGTILYSLSFLLLINATNWPIFFVFIFLFTIGEIANSTAMGPFYSRRIPSSHRGRVNSYMNIGAMIGTILGKLLIGYLIENFGFNQAYTTIGVFGVVATIITLFNLRLDKRTFPKLYESTD
ncbi:MAG: MFS transporter [Bacilli bacterium]|nr:MFS transporter [Bacilli bacterium]MBN2877637.1 MFS transporter [Bacilli bacterium]